jgi:hypothetical protein
MTEPDDALSIALDLARALGGAGISYAIGGALAFGYWAVPRATVDVDVNVFVSDTELDGLVACLARAGIDADAEVARRQSESAGLIVVRWRGLRVDLFTPSIPFSREAERTRVEIEVHGERFWLLSSESIAVFKLLFYRPKDIADLAQLVALRSELDAPYVRRWIVDMMGEDDERVARWDVIVASKGASI